MKSISMAVALIASVLLSASPDGADAQQIYKWVDDAGRVHYGENKPEDAAQAQMLNIAPTASVPVSAEADANAAEIARLNALTEQMARERLATEQARQEQAIRNLEQENQQLKNDLLNEQLKQQQQKQDSSSNVIIYPAPYIPYPYLHPPRPPYPYPPCRPWPTCQSSPTPAITPKSQPAKPLAKPNPPFKPASAGIARESQGVFRAP